jgi:hypothetical protein
VVVDQFHPAIVKVIANLKTITIAINPCKANA